MVGDGNIIEEAVEAHLCLLFPWHEAENATIEGVRWYTVNRSISDGLNKLFTIYEKTEN